MNSSNGYTPAGTFILEGIQTDSRAALPVPFTYADHRVWISR